MKLSQQEVALRARMDRAFISEVETGKLDPSVKSLFRLCAAIGVRASTILARVERKKYGYKR
ncbi:MAG: Helix-turn-helix domain [Phycisphaerales bacterium]|nr:Helix-turn-helix domain [Phycisphaerales bacterium]